MELFRISNVYRIYISIIICIFIFYVLILNIISNAELIRFTLEQTNMSEHKHDNGVCHCKTSVAAQSLTEMDFDRGIWSAGEY